MTFQAALLRAFRRTRPRTGLRHFYCLLAGTAAFSILAVQAMADDLTIPRTTFGSAGLIEMPSARMAPDGELSASISLANRTQHYNLGFQVLPWLETSFRYSGLAHFDPAFPVYYDRSFGVKLRLWDETDVFPALSVGTNDIVGTGVYGGEYLVASKRLGTVDATLGMGWGRLSGNEALRNPLTLLSSKFKTRSQFSDIGGILSSGQANFSSLFRGPKVGLFAGAVWHTPLDGLSLVAEYSSDRYIAERARGNFIPKTSVNVGVSYAPIESVVLGLNWLYGSSLNASIAFLLDPTTTAYPEKVSTPLPPETVRTAPQQQHAIAQILQPGMPVRATSLKLTRGGFADALLNQDDVQDVKLTGRTLVLSLSHPSANRCEQSAQLAKAYGADIEIVLVSSGQAAAQRCRVADAALITAQEPETVDTPAGVMATPRARGALEAQRLILADATKQRLNVAAVRINRSEAILYYENGTYFSESEAVQRLTRILMADAPPDVEKFRIVSLGYGGVQREFDALRGPLERSVVQLEDQAQTFNSSILMRPAPLDNPVLATADRATYPRFSWSVAPQLREALFDPARPLGIQLLGSVAGSLELMRGLSVNGSVEASLYDNFNTNNPSNSVLPHVRSDFLRYFTQGKTGIGNLEVDYRFRLAPSIFAVARAGYVESMFAGVGGEVLWRPEGQRWSMGFDLYDVQQRQFDRLFGLQPYRIVTGHANLYYASPWYDLNFGLHVGRYLAGDRGFTLEVTRRFSTGVEIGAFFTRTNVSALNFGEGSFDKGIIIRIPLSWMLPTDTQSQVGFDLRPIQRDGGQRIYADALLFEETRRGSFAEMNLQQSGAP